MEPQAAHEQAHNHVAEVRWFYGDVAAFTLVAGWAQVLAIAGQVGRWQLWTFSIWALALISHGLKVFVFDGRFNAAWEKRAARDLTESR